LIGPVLGRGPGTGSFISGCGCFHGYGQSLFTSSALSLR